MDAKRTEVRLGSTKQIDYGGRACKPESSSTSVFSITSVESINAICQKSVLAAKAGFVSQLWHSFFACTLPRTSPESAFSAKSITSGLPFVPNRGHAPGLQFRTAISLWCLLNLPHLLLERSSGGSQHHDLKGKDAESEEAQEHANGSSLALYA